MPNARAGCEAFPEQINATTGQHIEVVLNAGETITRLVDAEAFGSCNMTGATELIAAPAKGAHDAVYTFNKADTYYLTSAGMGGWSGPHCAGGLKVKIVVTGADNGDNAGSSTGIFAPMAHANPGLDADFEPFGKGVYHDRQYDEDLHLACETDADGFCLDRSESVGSCYYGGEDFHVGHAVFCDVTEVECCGYIGCSAGENRGKFANGTSHSYYWYAPGYRSSRDNCCHCAASCDITESDRLRAAAGTEGMCTYYDVTTPDCQRATDMDSIESTTIGFLKCAMPESKTVANAFVREDNQDKPEVIDSDGRKYDDEASAAAFTAKPVALVATAAALAAAVYA